ncbi:MarR family transcriptional regulator [Glaciihabitans arcticus]|uniref:MarR family transcriptional regulator n=1 Tax=Glaciihabitans arcticus TaxID=2668039 RepID=A0A4Q9GUB2_9MICO|nr:MarR family winged helix-turn-helix transcriptional regulator [Glaciihabitans arcticus]TBN58341.1 MarR family transcriptional regulator [Glaciihabitans arcticus]
MTAPEAHSDSDQAIADVEEQLGMLFGRARAVWKDSAAQIHPELQPVGYKLLSTIVRLGETNAFALTQLLETDKSVVSRQVRVLEDLGFVSSRADEKDGRARVLTPTPNAVSKVRAIRGAQQERLRELLRSQPVDDLHAFVNMLQLISGS